MVYLMVYKVWGGVMNKKKSFCLIVLLVLCSFNHPVRAVAVGVAVVALEFPPLSLLPWCMYARSSFVVRVQSAIAAQPSTDMSRSDGVQSRPLVLISLMP